MIRRLCEFAVKRLERIFNVPGLPLVAKSSPDLHTTSILVRGGPGTGKTTLALAVGQAVAADGDGVLVYLTTEFSPAEISFKAQLLRLEERNAQIWAWDGRPRSHTVPARAGCVFVHHISPPDPQEPESGESAASSASKKQFILETAWRLLGVDDKETAPRVAGLPVRAVVIDAFILPDYGSDDAEVRSNLVTFIQALETLGVTPVLVEEVAPDSPSWFPFIVDLVFELSHQRMPEGEWGRTLTCTKSRYGLVSAGPHTYSLSAGTPALFPTIRHSAHGIPGVARPLRFALPIQRDLWHVAEGHQVILSPVEDPVAFNIFVKTPGAVVIHVEFGFPCTIDGPGYRGIVDESEGPSVLAWSILDVVEKCHANVVILGSISRVMRREWWQLPIEQILDALRHLGLVVIVADAQTATNALAPVADISILTAAPSSPGPSSGAPRRFPSAAGPIEYQPQIRRAHSLSFTPPPFIPGLLWLDNDDEHSRSLTLDGEWLASGLYPLRTSLYWPSLYWLLACGWVAGNLDALDALEGEVMMYLRERANFAALLVRARGRWQGVEAAEHCAERLVERAPWVSESHGLLGRIKSEIRLDSEEPAVVDEGIAQLRGLLEQSPPPHKAEMLYNLALVLHLRGDLSGASDAVAASLAINPRLVPSSRLQDALL